MPSYARFLVAGHGTELSVDFVNDIPLHFGDFEFDKSLGKVDSWRNILSNEISAPSRLEMKDFVYVWALCREYKFDWKEIMNEAEHKEASVYPPEISNLFIAFPFENLNTVKWVEGFDHTGIKEDFTLIARDIFYGKPNSLA